MPNNMLQYCVGNVTFVYRNGYLRAWPVFVIDTGFIGYQVLLLSTQQMGQPNKAGFLLSES